MEGVDPDDQHPAIVSSCLLKDEREYTDHKRRGGSAVMSIRWRVNPLLFYWKHTCLTKAESA